MPTVIAHGGYSQESKYEVVQHRYMGGDDEGVGGFVEVLEIKDHPPGRHPVVLSFWGTGWDYHFWDFETVELAVQALEKSWGSPKIIDKQPGLLSKTVSKQKPWFYEP